MARVQLNISARELKHKDNDVIEVTSKGVKVGEFNYSSYDYIMANFINQAQAQVLIENEYNTRSATSVRNEATSTPKNPIVKAIKEKGLTLEQQEKLLAYIDKMVK